MFEDQNHARLLWSQNLDFGDLPNRYPENFESPYQPGVMDDLNMSKITRMQRYYCWQPHLPFVSVYLKSEPWAERYNFTFDTLPIIESGEMWYLAPSTGLKWKSHLKFFMEIVSHFRGGLALVPASVDYLPSISNYVIERGFPTQINARKYFWYFRTLIFLLFADFSYICSVRPNWRERIITYCKENQYPLDIAWLDEVEVALCDFRYTKRAGVVIDLSTTRMSSSILRYYKHGVPVIMDAGNITFHDQDPFPISPSVNIYETSWENSSHIPTDWPTKAEILKSAKEYLLMHFPLRCQDFEQIPPPPPLSYPLTRPRVEEIGGDVHRRLPTTAWINPIDNRPAPEIQVAPLMPPNPRRSKETLGWVEFFEKRKEANKKSELTETPIEKQRRESRLKDSLKRNRDSHHGPAKKSSVYEWVQVESENVVGEMSVIEVPAWKRVRVESADWDEAWGRFKPSQRVFDPYNNEWDLHVLFDPAPEPSPHDYFDDEDEDEGTHLDKLNSAIYLQQIGKSATTVIPSPPQSHESVADSGIAPTSDVQSQTQQCPNDPDVTMEDGTGQVNTVTYLDGLGQAPTKDPFSDVLTLSSKIAFFAPDDLSSWAYQCLGMRGVRRVDPPVSYPHTVSHMGFVIEETHKKTITYEYLQEFTSYIVRKEFNNPRLADLSDLHPGHPHYLNLSAATMFIRLVQVSSSPTGTQTRPAYILTLKRDRDYLKRGWILLLFEATSVIQICRNRWGVTMEGLVQRLIMHGIQFRTLVPAPQDLPEEIVELHEAPAYLTTMPPMKEGVSLTADDYDTYVSLKNAIVKSPHGRAAYRMGGVLWRLAMECKENFDDVVEEILEGPCYLGSSRGEIFYIDGNRYYDDVVRPLVGDMISGIHGTKVGRNQSTGCKFFFISSRLFWFNIS